MSLLVGLTVAALFGAPATAAPEPSLAGRAILVTPCVEDPAAPCWEQAQVLDRFAPAPGALVAPVTADVRLAWDGSRLLVRATGLPADATVEVAVSPDAREDRLKFVSAGIVGGDPAAPRVQAFPLDRPPNAGDERLVRVSVVRPDEGGEIALPWASRGAGDQQHLPHALWVDALPVHLPLDIERATGGIAVTAPGASRIDVTHEAPAMPHNPAWSTAPWTTSATDHLSFAPPEAGWYTVRARWTAEGRTTDLQERRFWSDGAASDDASWNGIHPAPLWRMTARGRPFRVRPGLEACSEQLEFAAAATVLADEIERFTGVRPTVKQGTDCDLVIRAATGAAGLLPPEAAEIAQRAESFGLVVTSSRVTVLAADLRGAVYGALALADALGPEGEAPALQAADAPAMGMRVLYHAFNLRAVPDFEVETYLRFLRVVVARGRYNLFIFNPTDSYQYERHPEIAHDKAIERATLLRILAAARELGIEVAPGANEPGHADWISRAHPELVEDTSQSLLCTRHPDTRPLLSDLYDELLDVFGEVRWFHVGHDEVLWMTDRSAGEEWCPRCAGTPRWELLREDIEWNVDFFEQRGIRPIIWTDMLLEGWHGGQHGTDDLVGALSEHARKQLLLMAWSSLGDPVEKLARAGDGGFDLARVHTGYFEWKRAGLVEQAPHLVGEGLGLFTPTPWSALGPSTGDWPLYYHSSSVVLAGLTAWRPSLADTTISATLTTLSESPAYLVGYVRAPGWSGRTLPLAATGAPLGADLPTYAWPARLRVTGVDYGPPLALVARVGSPVTAAVGRPVAGISLLHATVLAHDAEQALRSDARRSARAGLDPAASLWVRYGDGQEREAPIEYGMGTYAADGGPRSLALWQTAGTLRLSSDTMVPEATDRSLYRIDWANPRPDVPIERVEVRTRRRGIAVVVAAISTLEPGRRQP